VRIRRGNARRPARGVDHGELCPPQRIGRGKAALLRHPNLPRSTYGRHFSRQVKLGGLLLLALVLGQMS
jgi:hypothetical protein